MLTRDDVPCRARNEEKAASMLNKFLQEKKKGDAPKRGRKRPFLASECKEADEADRWRQQVLREIGRKVMEIQNEGLGEERIRELNDEINKLIREKGHWEKRIVQLGGPDFSKKGTGLGEENEGVGGRQYQYFGAAKNLPGVREMLQASAPQKSKRTRQQMYKTIDMDYFGLRDDEDGLLERLEREAEERLREEEIEKWKRNHPSYAHHDWNTDEELEKVTGLPAGFMPSAMLPTNEEIENLVLEKKKQELLAKYASA